MYLRFSCILEAGENAFKVLLYPQLVNYSEGSWMKDIKEMEDLHSVNSPKRTLSVSKNNKRATFSFPYDKASVGFDVSGEHGLKPSEVNGFVGSISTVVAAAIFIMWAWPVSWLHAVGIFYYPSRYWALAVPAYFMMSVVLGMVFYIGLNFMATPPPTSFSTMFDDLAREPLIIVPSADSEERPIKPISDIRIDQINNLMFNSS